MTMKNVRNLFLILLICSGLFASCEQKEKKPDQAVLNEAEQPANKQETEKNTQINFAEKNHDFGKIMQGNMVSHTFEFANTGEAPLVIMDAKASCGCTVPQWTKEPIAPGDTGQVEVTYNGSGSGQIHKTVTVFANTEPKETILEITADVKPIDMDNKGPFKK